MNIIYLQIDQFFRYRKELALKVNKETEIKFRNKGRDKSKIRNDIMLLI